MSNEIKDRLSEIKFRKGLTNKALAEIMNATESTIKNYLTGRTKIPIPKLEMLSERLNVPLIWLINGTESTHDKKPYIFTEHKAQHHSDVEGNTQDYKYLDHSEIDKLVGEGEANKSIPLFSFEVMSAPIESVANQTITPIFKMHIPGFEDCDFNFIFFEQAMIPTYQSGCMILSKSVKDKDLIIPGESYVIFTPDYRIVRRLQDSDRPGHILAIADNPNGRYQPIQIPLEKIVLLYLIKGAILRTQL